MFSFLPRYAAFAQLPLRLCVAVIMLAHGADKLFGTFSGGSFAKTAQMFEAGLGMHPGWLTAGLAGGGELLGGFLVGLGLFTRFGAFLIAACMAVAVFKVHWVHGLFAQNQGFEYPMALLGVAISLMLSGAGRLALDNVLSINLRK